MARKKKKEIEDKNLGSKRALVYDGKYFYYFDSESKRIAENKIKAWKVLKSINKEKQNDN